MTASGPAKRRPKRPPETVLFVAWSSTVSSTLPPVLLKTQAMTTVAPRIEPSSDQPPSPVATRGRCHPATSRPRSRLAPSAGRRACREGWP